jgi:hypothetical protein
MKDIAAPEKYKLMGIFDQFILLSLISLNDLIFI